jgi:hypothetical protein
MNSKRVLLKLLNEENKKIKRSEKNEWDTTKQINMSITVISEGAVKEKGVEVYLKKQ